MFPAFKPLPKVHDCTLTPNPQGACTVYSQMRGRNCDR